MHINQTRNLPCPAPPPLCKPLPAPDPATCRPEPELPSPWVPGGHRLEIHLTARARGRGLGPGGQGSRHPQTKKPVRLGAGSGSAREPVGTRRRPGPQPGLARTEKGLGRLRWAEGGRLASEKGSGVGGGAVNPVYIYFLPFPPSASPLFPPPPRFFPPSTWIFSCCVTGTNLCKALPHAAPRARRQPPGAAGWARPAGKGGDLGNPERATVRHPSPCHPAPREAPQASSRTGVESRCGGSRSPAPMSILRSFHFGRCESGEHRSPPLGTLYTFSPRVGAVTPAAPVLSSLVSCPAQH